MKITFFLGLAHLPQTKSILSSLGRRDPIEAKGFENSKQFGSLALPLRKASRNQLSERTEVICQWEHRDPHWWCRTKNNKMLGSLRGQNRGFTHSVVPKLALPIRVSRVNF